MRSTLSLLLFLVLTTHVEGQDRPPAGPTILSAGAVFAIEDPSFPTPMDREYKLAFELAQAAPSPDQLSVTLNSVARYLNMHADAGVPTTQVKAAIIVHGSAGWEVLDHAAYRDRHGVDNPNVGLIQELLAAGVQIVLCGQTAASRGIPTEGLVDGVDVALSAMTAFMILQDEGYRVNPW